MTIGRLAPSPTGLLHLGNAWAFLLAWLDMRGQNGRLILRLEDIDPLRAKAHWAEAAREDILWLGLDWDEEAPPQSSRSAFYEKILDDLTRRALTYPCYCTRKELRSLAGAPQAGDSGAPYPGTCRRLSSVERAQFESEGRKSSLRLICPEDQRWDFIDRIQGRVSMTLSECGGDFALRRSDGVFAYQLAVVADDLAFGVDSVARGADILASTPRQLYLYSLLGGVPPSYAHLPLVLDAQGERLAKRHASLSLAALREAGVRPETLLGALCRLAGLTEQFRPATAKELAGRVRLEDISTKPLRLPENPVEYLLRLQSKD